MVFTSHNSSELKWTESVYQQSKESVKFAPLDEVGKYAPFFNLTTDDVAAVQGYLRYWMVLRQCCGSQMARENRLRLHGCNNTAIKDNADSLSWPACEMYKLPQVIGLLKRTSLFASMQVKNSRDLNETALAEKVEKKATEMIELCNREEQLIVHKGLDFNLRPFRGCDNVQH